MVREHVFATVLHLLVTQSMTPYESAELSQSMISNSTSRRLVRPIAAGIVRGLIVLVCFFAQSPVLAQTDDAVQYDVPDIPDSWAEALRYKNEHFSLA